VRRCVFDPYPLRIDETAVRIEWFGVGLMVAHPDVPLDRNEVNRGNTVGVRCLGVGQ
jgi:hypothetical protein